jgi:hypothetical protein
MSDGRANSDLELDSAVRQPALAAFGSVPVNGITIDPRPVLGEPIP